MHRILEGDTRNRERRPLGTGPVTQAAEGHSAVYAPCLLNLLARESFNYWKYSHDENTGYIESVHLRGRQETRCGDQGGGGALLKMRVQSEEEMGLQRRRPPRGCC